MKYLLFVLLGLTVLLGGCANMTKGMSIAGTQVYAFHQQFNNSDYKSIIASADTSMFGNSSKADVSKFLAVVHKKLGKVKNSQTTNWNMNTFNGVTMVNLVQSTQFEKGTGTETFNFRISGQKAYMTGYNINSTDLIMK